MHIFLIFCNISTLNLIFHNVKQFVFKEHPQHFVTKYKVPNGWGRAPPKGPWWGQGEKMTLVKWKPKA